MVLTNPDNGCQKTQTNDTQKEALETVLSLPITLSN